MHFFLRQVMVLPNFSWKLISHPQEMFKAFLDFSKVNAADAFREEAHMKRLQSSYFL